MRNIQLIKSTSNRLWAAIVDTFKVNKSTAAAQCNLDRCGHPQFSGCSLSWMAHNALSKFPNKEKAK